VKSIEERIQAVADKWFLMEPLLFMTLMSHKITPNKGLRHAIRCGQGRIEYCYDNKIEELSDAEFEENLRAEVIRILLLHPYRKFNGKKDTAYMASNVTLNEYYSFKFLKYKAADIWGKKPEYRKQNFEFYYREILQLPGAPGGSDISKNRADNPLSSSSNDTSPSNNDNPQPSDGDSSQPSDGDNQQASDSNNSQTSDKNKSRKSGKNKSQTSGSNSSQTSDDDNSDDAGESQDDSVENQSNSDDEEQNLSDEEQNLSDEEQNGETNDVSEEEERAALWDEDDFMEQKVKEVIEWAHTNMQWGSLSGKLVETLEASLQTKIDYRKVLNGFRATVLSSDKMLTRFKPSRRYGFQYMGKKSQFTTTLLIGVDVSGSVPDKDVRRFYYTVNRFFKYGIQSIDVLQFDADLTGEVCTMKKAQKRINVTGRGGTAFSPIIEYFTNSKKRYDGLIIFTDGYADVPHVKPSIARKILWICDNKENYERHHNWMERTGRCCWIE
jgi:hypothetical protein